MVFVDDRGESHETLFGSDCIVLENTSNSHDALVHLMISEDAVGLSVLTRWAVFTLLSLYFFWAAMFCSLLGSTFLPPPPFLPLFETGPFLLTWTDADGDGEGECSTRSTSGVGDLAGGPLPCLLLPEVLAGLGTIVEGGRYSEETSSSLLLSGLGYRLTGWGFAPRKVLNRRVPTHTLLISCGL